MTPEQRAAKVVLDIREHGLFNHVTDERWMRYIADAIEQATEGYLPIPDANEFDDVVRLLGIEDSNLTPVEAVEELMGQAKAWKEACRKAGICMSCATGELGHPCHDCLGTGWNGGAPVGYVAADELPREPGTCKCGRAPINKDGICATCEDEQRPAQWRAFHAVAWPHLWGIETTDPVANEAGLEIVIAPCMPEHAAKEIASIFNNRT